MIWTYDLSLGKPAVIPLAYLFLVKSLKYWKKQKYVLTKMYQVQSFRCFQREVQAIM